MSNGNSPQYSSDQISAILQAANGTGAQPTQQEIQAYQNNPEFLNSLTIGGNWQPNQGSTQYGTPGVGGTMQGGTNMGSFLGLLNAFGGGGGNKQPSGTPLPVSQNPMYAATNLGAAALQMPGIYNPTPGQGNMTKGGVNPVQPATFSGELLDKNGNPILKNGQPQVAAGQTGGTVPGVPAQYANAP
jgi:hypothetical protein